MSTDIVIISCSSILVIGIIVVIIILIAGHKTAHVNETVIVVDRKFGNVIKIIRGPCNYFVDPFGTEIHIIDMSMKLARFEIPDLVTADSMPLSSNLEIAYTCHPHDIRPEARDKLWRFLSTTEQIVEGWATYIIQSLVSCYKINDILQNPKFHSEIERLFYDKTKVRLKTMGIRVEFVRLILKPTPYLLTAHSEIQAKVLMLTALGEAYNNNRGVVNAIPAELILQLLSGNLPYIAGVDLSPYISPTYTRQQGRYLIDSKFR